MFNDEEECGGNEADDVLSRSERDRWPYRPPRRCGKYDQSVSA